MQRGDREAINAILVFGQHLADGAYVRPRLFVAIAVSGDQCRAGAHEGVENDGLAM